LPCSERNAVRTGTPLWGRGGEAPLNYSPAGSTASDDGRFANDSIAGGRKAKPPVADNADGFAARPQTLAYILPKPSYLDVEERMKRQTGTHVIEIKTVGELISALQFVAADGEPLHGIWEVEWIANKVRLQMNYYPTEAYEWSYT
jgi:hypothetical protein